MGPETLLDPILQGKASAADARVSVVVVANSETSADVPGAGVASAGVASAGMADRRRRGPLLRREPNLGWGV